MTARAEVTATVTAARDRFRNVHMNILPRWMRRAVARAVRELAAAIAPTDVSAAAAYEDLAVLVDIEIVRPPASSSLPPDDEGDEPLLERRGRMASRGAS